MNGSGRGNQRDRRGSGRDQQRLDNRCHVDGGVVLQRDVVAAGRFVEVPARAAGAPVLVAAVAVAPRPVGVAERFHTVFAEIERAAVVEGRGRMTRAGMTRSATACLSPAGRRQAQSDYRRHRDEVSHDRSLRCSLASDVDELFRPFVLRAGSAGLSPPLLLGGRFPFVTEDFGFFGIVRKWKQNEAISIHSGESPPSTRTIKVNLRVTANAMPTPTIPRTIRPVTNNR